MQLNDLRLSFQLYALCAACDRMEAVDIAALLKILPADTPVDIIRRRVRCSHCRTRTEDIRIVYVGQGDRAATFQYRR